ncbi:Piso0_002913 [Millerozyma farinosa CBS 7064]|uniref:Piso0_002913 protein n=1 Tax=Pichia sorbitophila (strain ATCC MYA-4447 / BCRC 22081 / CBS 7064 / NBRC 10061 / NRRL Y-12695) TaxID=559304 RepID=G8YJU2_PICSO|nr:Piso0_002913 [Millerozyma farinosa CBS 7064]CCE80587.1 Piso0_002913 [Millerozyma farinosa CBS 7064]
MPYVEMFLYHGSFSCYSQYYSICGVIVANKKAYRQCYLSTTLSDSLAAFSPYLFFRRLEAVHIFHWSNTNGRCSIVGAYSPVGIYNRTHLPKKAGQMGLYQTVYNHRSR